jgi:ataxia telangiectasia mutated family protein
MDVDDKDGFGPIRTTQTATPLAENQHLNNSGANCCITEICVSFLTLVPILQSSSGEPTRDKELTEFVLDCAAESFILVGYAFFNKICQRTLTLSMNNLDNFLEKLESLLQEYAWSRSEKIQLLAVHLLQSTLPLWLQRSVAVADTGHKIRLLCDWLSNMIIKKKARYWRVRDYIARFLEKYLSLDPQQEIWLIRDDAELLQNNQLPQSMLPSLGADEDIRVRFRAAVLSPRLFSVARTIGRDPMLVYVDIKQYLTVVLSRYAPC